MITLTNVTKLYVQADAPALDGVSLEIGKGDVFGIIGRSGAGKSTLLRMLNGLESPTSGSVTIDAVAVETLPPADLRRLRRRIGMIFQNFGLLSSRTVADNVGFPLRLAGIPRGARREKVATLLDRVGLTALAARYPAQLSGGQRQRVGIARALATDPDILLCDEATSALDPETTRDVLALLRDLNRDLGLTIVLITHEMEVVRSICDHVAVIEAGRIVETGAVGDVFAAARHPATRRMLAGVAA